MKTGTITATALLSATLGLIAGCGTSAGSSPASPASQHSAKPSTASASPSRPPTAEVIAARMHLHHVTAYTAATDPNHLLGRQGGYTSDVDAGPTYSPGSTGSIGIEVFPDTADAITRLAYLHGFAGTFLGDGYDYRVSTALLRLDGHYTPVQAHRLLAAFRAAVDQ